MKKGRVYWITGLPGSGKTTIGTALFYELREKQDNVVILDGDILKQFVGDSVGYSDSDRYIRAKKYSNICKILSDQGLCVIICTVAMFEEIRRWNRNNIQGYIEIFLDVPLNVLVKRNKKGLYSGIKKDDRLLNVEYPQNPDLEVLNDDNASVNGIVEKITSLVPQNESDFDRDKEYWNHIYENGSITEEPSPFAKAVISDMKTRGKDVLELGCGNGRDSMFFAREGFRVTGIDASNNAIGMLKERSLKMAARFICDDFVKCKTIYSVLYDSIYSRFTLHAISENQETELLINCIKALKSNGRLYIEARSVKDELYGLGTRVDNNAFVYNGHYRRFIEINTLTKKMETMGYRIISAEESKGLSRTKNQDPVLIRIVSDACGRALVD